MNCEDVISGIITGLVVGFILWILQLRREKKQLINEFERELSILKERLSYIDYDLNDISLNSIKDSIPPYVLEVILVQENSPLDLIVEYAKSNHTLAINLVNVRKKYLEVMKKSRTLDSSIKRHVRNYNAKIGTYSIDDNEYIIYFVGKILSRTDSDIEPYLEHLGLREDMIIEFSKFEKYYKDLIKEYLDSRKLLLDHLKIVKENIN